VETADSARRGDARGLAIVVAGIEGNACARHDATGDQKLLLDRDVDAVASDRSLTDTDDQRHAGSRGHVGRPRQRRELGDERTGEQLHRPDVGGLARSN